MKYYFPFDFFSTFEDVKSIYNSQAIQHGFGLWVVVKVFFFFLRYFLKGFFSFVYYKYLYFVYYLLSYHSCYTINSRAKVKSYIVS